MPPDCLPADAELCTLHSLRSLELHIARVIDNLRKPEPWEYLTAEELPEILAAFAIVWRDCTHIDRSECRPQLIETKPSRIKFVQL